MVLLSDGPDGSPYRPAGRWFSGGDRRRPLKDTLERHGQLGPGQTAGRFWPVACVALEVTQRCNLDCTLCYLSDQAEAAHDVPLPILLDRLATLESHYGAGTSVQLTGGDPTLRSADDLARLCRDIRARGMRSCLMTNGIRATRPLLERLREAGLDDVAFHVDLTQERKGYATERELNALRQTYLERARGLGLRVLFNTTVFDRNLAEVADIARFMRDHAAEVTLASFQLQADTGRGVLGSRGVEVTTEAVAAALEEGVETSLDFDVAAVGHARCNRYTAVLVAGGKALSPFSDRQLFFDLLAGMEASARWRGGYLRTPPTLARLAWTRPWLSLSLVRHASRLAWQRRNDLLRSRGRVHRLSFLIHNFMDAEVLDEERCACCVFKVATRDGPLSMCAHNVQRDAHVFAPAPLATAAGEGWWDAASGEIRPTPTPSPVGVVPPKRRKGRARLASSLKTGDGA